MEFFCRGIVRYLIMLGILTHIHLGAAWELEVLNTDGIVPNKEWQTLKNECEQFYKDLNEKNQNHQTHRMDNFNNPSTEVLLKRAEALAHWTSTCKIIIDYQQAIKKGAAFLEGKQEKLEKKIKKRLADYAIKHDEYKQNLDVNKCLDLYAAYLKCMLSSIKSSIKLKEIDIAREEELKEEKRIKEEKAVLQRDKRQKKTKKWATHGGEVKKKSKKSGTFFMGRVRDI